MPWLDDMAAFKAIKAKWHESEVIMITGFPTVEVANRLGMPRTNPSLPEFSGLAAQPI